MRKMPSRETPWDEGGIWAPERGSRRVALIEGAIVREVGGGEKRKKLHVTSGRSGMGVQRPKLGKILERGQGKLGEGRHLTGVSVGSRLQKKRSKGSLLGGAQRTP